MADVPARSRSLLNDRQRRVVGFALTLLAALATAALLVGGVIWLGRLAAFFSAVLWPLAAAGILALILRPLVEIFEHRLRLSRLAAVIVLYALVLLLLAGLLILLLPPLIDQIAAFVAFLPTVCQHARDYLSGHYPAWIDLIQRQLAHPAIRQMADQLSGQLQSLLANTLPTLKAAGSGVLGIFSIVTQLAIVPIYLFFFLLSRGAPMDRLAAHLAFLRPPIREDVLFLIREFIAIVVAFFRGQILIGLIMGVLLAAGFSLIGLKFGLAIGLALGVLNIIPYLGTIIGLAVALPLAFLQPGGGWHLVALVLLVDVVVQCVEGWFLTPRIMGRRTGLHPVMIIVAIFFWGTVFHGILGMLFAIPLTAFFVTFWRLLRHKYWVTDAAGKTAFKLPGDDDGAA